jgi:predicted nucleic acid-binding protein
MKYVVDANIILSGLIADSMTRRLLVELEDGLLTPAYVHDEIGTYTEMVSEKSGLSPAAVDELIELLFERIDVVPRPVVLESLQEAARIMRNTDPDDAVYLAAAIERDAHLWSDDGDYDEQDAVPVARTSEVVERFEQR